MVPGTHGSTYGGNPLGCAVGKAVLDEVSEPAFLDEVKRKATHLRQRLAELADDHPDEIAEIRGEGLMIGIRFHDSTPVGDVVGAAYAQHMLTVPAAENTMRMLPPLNVSDEDLSEAVSRLDAAITAAKAA
jgi:acetylornithine/N-succinyldiaminopimelate aminotransferase